jgi:hypothetical protein
MLELLDKNFTSVQSNREKKATADIDARLKEKMTAYQNLTQNSNTVTGESTQELGNFRTTLPSELRARFDQVSSILANGDGAKKVGEFATQAGDKIAPIAVATAKEVKNMAGKAVEAAKTGDLSEVKKLADGVRETISANGDKVLEYTGAAAITKLFEPFQKE